MSSLLDAVFGIVTGTYVHTLLFLVRVLGAIRIEGAICIV